MAPRVRTRSTSAVLGAALLLALVGCATAPGGGGPTPSPTDSPTASPTDSPETESPEPGASTAAPSDAPEREPVAEGSGCDPGPGDLPDGRWYGLVEGVTRESLTFDLACWYVMDEATIAAAQDGAESPPPNSYYVRNTRTDVREVPLADDVAVTAYPTGDPQDVVTGAISDLLDVAQERGSYPFGIWIEVLDGEVVELEEQWVP